MKLKGSRRGPALSANLLLFLFLCSFTTTGTAQTSGTFTPTGDMTAPRMGHTATLLLNGKVLIIGGSSARLASAEIFDPVTGTFAATGDMTMPRFGHSATLLSDGRVLVAGGYYYGFLATAE